MTTKVKYFDKNWKEVTKPKRAAYAVRLTFDTNGTVVRSETMLRAND